MTLLRNFLLLSFALFAVACATEAELSPIESGAASTRARPGHALAPVPDAPVPDAPVPDAPVLSDDAAAAQQTDCSNDTPCPDPLECIRYYGVAGPAGPAFHSCELPCGGETDGACPVDQTCVHISDGPGSVCVPVEPN